MAHPPKLSVWYDPGWHRSHAAGSGVGRRSDEMASQEVHSDAPAVIEKVRGGQTTHGARESVDDVPGGQVRHEMAPLSAALVPCGHGRHSEPPNGLCVPRVHARQAEWPAFG